MTDKLVSTGSTTLSLSLAPKWNKIGTKLLDQQFWCWGQDILRPQGNGLVEFGFSRRPAPPGTTFPSIYELELSNDRRVVLRGFGLSFRAGDVEVYFERYKFAPMLFPIGRSLSRCWAPQDVPRLEAARSRVRTALATGLSAQCFAWIAEYERKVKLLWGYEYRTRVLGRLKSHAKKPNYPPVRSAHLWSCLAREFSQRALVS